MQRWEVRGDAASRFQVCPLMDQEFYFCQADLVQSNFLPLDVIFWKFNVSLWSHNLDAENDNQKSNKRNRPGLCWHVMKTVGVSWSWHARIPSSFPDTGDTLHLKLLETKMMPFRDCWEAGPCSCCGGAAHHNTLIPFWLNSCKFGLHAIKCRQ